MSGAAGATIAWRAAIKIQKQISLAGADPENGI
jgi:hypothetical protein